MAMTIAHNISAINTRRTLDITQRALTSSLEKLSSGYRINTGKDGPADLVISEQLRAQANGLERAVRNTQEAINVIGIAEGALNEMNAILKTMKSLALHAANSGITSPEQMQADQAEVDSAISTIDRIANTTKYTDQLLLNGAKSMDYIRTTNVDDPLDAAMLDVSLSRIDQIFKREDFQVGIAFTGENNAGSAADPEKIARRAYFDAYDSESSADITDDSLTADQQFILTGTKGARGFSFADGTHLGDVATAINNVSDSTGIGATLTFDTAALTNATELDGAGDTLDAVGARTTRAQSLYNITNTERGIAEIVTPFDLLGGVPIEVGKHTDGHGRMYVKWLSATDFEVYKDEDMTIKVANGVSGAAITEANNSGLRGEITATAGADVPQAGDISIVVAGKQLEFERDADTAAGVDASGLGGVSAMSDVANSSVVTGVELGVNTDSTGHLYFKFTGAEDNKTIQVFKDAAMTEEQMVAEATGADLDGDNASHIKVNATQLENGESSGLYMTLSFRNAVSIGNGTITGSMKFDKLGVRVYSTEYGSEAFVKVDQREGRLFSYYEDPAIQTTTLLDAGSTGESVTMYGNDGKIAMNGQTVSLVGTTANVSTQDIKGELRFNEGELGKTTIGAAGYDIGALYSSATEINNRDSHATNPFHNTSEILNNFTGGMQFQLGEGASDMERTVFSIQSMAIQNLGRVRFVDDFEGKGIIETRQLSLGDILGGGTAALANDPVKALGIIEQAISDVSTLRARLGAAQTNLLQTNANSLGVAIENIVKTESVIRDADMAKETTNFTKNQILVSAGTSMLAQANTMAQNVLQLLG